MVGSSNYWEPKFIFNSFVSFRALDAIRLALGVSCIRSEESFSVWGRRMRESLNWRITILWVTTCSSTPRTCGLLVVRWVLLRGGALGDVRGQHGAGGCRSAGPPFGSHQHLAALLVGVVMICIWSIPPDWWGYHGSYNCLVQNTK